MASLFVDAVSGIETCGWCTDQLSNWFTAILRRCALKFFLGRIRFGRRALRCSLVVSIRFATTLGYDPVSSKVDNGALNRGTVFSLASVCALT